MIKELNITNFRVIDHIRIRNLSRINLFVGSNNSGKTTLLEALFLLAGGGNPELPIKINRFRSLNFISDNIWRSFFNNLKIKHPIIIKGESNEFTKRLEVTPLNKINSRSISDQFDFENPFDTVRNSSRSTSEPSLNGLNLYGQKKSKAKSSESKTIVYWENGINSKIIKGKPDYIKAIFENDLTLTYPDIPKRLENMLVDKKDKQLIKVAKKLDPSIKRIVIGVNGVIYVDTGLSRMLPIQLLGNGMVKLLTINLNLYDAKKGMLLIDEIDNGLHHSALKLLWQSIIEAAIDYDVQIFATTHSYESISALVESTEKEDMNNLIRVYRMEISNKRIDAKAFDKKTLKYFLDMDWEIR